jgi:hypothetical protein
MCMVGMGPKPRWFFLVFDFRVFLNPHDFDACLVNHRCGFCFAVCAHDAVNAKQFGVGCDEVGVHGFYSCCVVDGVIVAQDFALCYKIRAFLLGQTLIFLPLGCGCEIFSRLAHKRLWLLLCSCIYPTHASPGSSK